jgi:group II intron reverse transcriptase/maturase
MKPPNNVREKSAEVVEGRDRPGGIPSKSAKVRTQCRGALSSSLARVNEAARKDKRTRFTALLHHVDVAALERSFRRLKRRASAGVDGETVTSYEQGLHERLQNLCERVHTGRYRARPVRRVYIPKSDGGRRPLGVPTLEDKVVQGTVAEVLNAVYEADFLGFSYGFRPQRSPHHALAALHTAVMTQCVNWVLDADIRSFFDSVDHEWLLRIVRHRIADRRILRLIGKWLRAGVLEGDEWKQTQEGTPQGAAISPLLANIFLHYILDLWVHHWRQRHARGRVVIVRYCDDFVMGFQYKEDAEKMTGALKARLAQFGLELNEGKTRLIAFGRLPALSRVRQGRRRPATFAFLGFTHYCGWTRDGRFVLKRKTERKRLTRKLWELRSEARRRIHVHVLRQHQWLCSVLRGHYAYYGLPGNHRAMCSFRWELLKIWLRCLRRRSQRSHMTWKRFFALLDRLPVPEPQITRPRDALLVRVG